MPALLMSLLSMQRWMASISQHLLLKETFPGVSTGAEEKKMGIKSSSTRTLILRDVAVPRENLLGEFGRGHVIAFNILNIGRYKLAVGAVGGSKNAFEIDGKICKWAPAI